MYPPLNELVGQTVVALSINPERDLVAFHTTDGSAIAYEAFGHCCSSSWIEHISGLDRLLGQPVLATSEDESLDVSAPDARHTFIQSYRYTITTPRGSLDLELRNESNGYYGGSLNHLALTPNALAVASLAPLTADF